MKSFHIQSGGGIESLQLRDDPMPSAPGPTEVLVRIRANSLNNRELVILQGRYPLPVADDVVAGSDGAGEVVSVGSEVQDFEVGDRVMGVVFPKWFDGRFDVAKADQLGGSLDGLLTEYAVLDQSGLVPVPSHLSFDEAAALPCAGVTAWNAVMGGRGLRADESVLTLGSSTVSQFAIQIAKVFNAHVISTAGSDEKAAKLAELGADEVINRTSAPEWAKEVRELTEGRGVDHVIDVAGTLNESLRAAATDAEVAFIGTLGSVEAVDPRLLFGAVGTVRAVALGSRAHFRALNDTISDASLRPTIDRVFSFDDAPDAFRYYMKGGGFGKIIISHDTRTRLRPQREERVL